MATATASRAKAPASRGIGELQTFSWEGTDKRGVKLKGEELGKNANLVKAALRKQGINATKVAQKRTSIFGSSGAAIRPRDIAVVYAPCDEINAFYDPDAVTITMCDEYVDYYGELFAGYPADERQPAILGAVASTFLHEAGHALIHQLALPTVGREEDVADQLSTVILVASGDAGNALALDGAYAFIAESEGEVDDTPYWDEHALNEQRFYNTVCLIYGSDPDGWDDLVGEDDLPEERAEQCPDEYAQISTSWNRLLAPFLTVPTVRVKLEAK